MRLSFIPTLTGWHADQPGVGGIRLHGHWHLLARLLWLAVFVLTLAVFCANLLVGNYGFATTILLFVTTGVLFWRKPSDLSILLFSLVLFLTRGLFFPPLPLALWSNGAWWIPIYFLMVLGGITFYFVYAFPDGRFVPGFTGWLALGWITVTLVPIPMLGVLSHPWNWWLSPPYTLVRIAIYCSLVLALYLLSVLIPLSLGVALLRYRLWDIEILINRTLVYGVLTVSIVALYILVVVGLGTLLQAQGNLGLLAALRELTLQYSDQVAVHLDAPTCLPELSAAVEVAVYRIAQEALTNVMRHAAAQLCFIRLTLDEPVGWLSLSIQDDGCGLPKARSMGVGLISMRERAEELGGTWAIEPVESGGTHILVRLPCAHSDSADAAFVTPNLVPSKEE
jgi:hypothetical protein